jgi:segregation and condensation protein A
LAEQRVLEPMEKPFWLKPPWAVLFDLIRLQKVRPWDVNLNYLLTTLLGEMRKRGFVDFTASGIALLSSATIYRMKSELVLELQEPPKTPVERPIEFMPPPIQLPFRYEYTATTIDNMLKALEEALRSEAATQLQPRLTPITPAPPMLQEIDDFMIDIDKRIDEMYDKIVDLSPQGKIALSELDDRLSRLESVRVFILVLFLACNGRIQLWQDEEFGEIYVSLPDRGIINNGEDRSTGN